MRRNSETVRKTARENVKDGGIKRSSRVSEKGEER